MFVRNNERLLPVANITRIMKQILPENVKISNDSKEIIQDCVSEFIGFVTSEASDRLIEEKRKTITGDDVLDAMKSLGFDTFIPSLDVYLAKYRKHAKGDRPPIIVSGSGLPIPPMQPHIPDNNDVVTIQNLPVGPSIIPVTSLSEQSSLPPGTT